MLIEENGLRILTDPGTFSTQQDNVTDIDIILITHEHADHFHVPSVKAILAHNPQAKIITNTAVGKLLEKEGITSYTVVEHGQSIIEKGVSIEGFGNEHAVIYKTFPVAQNTGYFIANRLFYSGDALTNPRKRVEILALPVAGPWLKTSEVIDYALEINPSVCFPVHDAVLSHLDVGIFALRMVFPSKNITLRVLEIDKKEEF